MTSEQVKELHQLSSHFSEGKATPAHIKKLSELIVLINSNTDEDDTYHLVSEGITPTAKKMSSLSSF